MFTILSLRHCEKRQRRGNPRIDSYYYTICEITDFFAIFAIVFGTFSENTRHLTDQNKIRC